MEFRIKNYTAKEIDFKRITFFVLMDSVFGGIKYMLTAINNLNKTYSYSWQFNDMSEEIQTAEENVTTKYNVDVSQQLSNEVIH